MSEYQFSTDECKSWFDVKDGGSVVSFVPRITYFRIKPREIKVNGFDVPAPMSDAPKEGGKIYIVTLYSATGRSAADGLYSESSWCNSVNQHFWLKHGIVHSTKEAAIAHAKAMLGIDPNGGEE